MTQVMKIEQSDNGWILTFTGHDCLDKVKSFNDWKDVLAELEDYFGWYRNDKWTKEA